MSAPAERDQEIETLRRRLGALEAQAAGLGLAQVMTREFGGEIRFWSRGMERLYGFTTAEAVGKNSHKLLRTEFPQSLHALDQELLEREAWTGELRHRRRDGSDIVVVSHQSLLRDPGGGVSLVTEANNDITEERRGREARLYLASIVEFIRRRDHRQDAGWRCHELEPRGRGYLRLYWRGNDRTADHAAAPAGPGGRGGDDPRAPDPR